MKILLLGSGGREHAFAWKITQSKHCSKLFIAPGNAGTSVHGENVQLDILDFEAVKQFVITNNISIVLVGPEDPLVKGIHDFFSKEEALHNVAVIGPYSNGAMLEGSKDFAKKFMLKHNIPTAAYQSFAKETLTAGYKFLETLKPPYVLKADGLAAGKGVVILNELDAAKEELKDMLVGEKFGNAGNKVVIEEFLQGIEMSAFVITDGNSYKILPSAKDYKRIGEGDTGPNTGGMGTVSPVPFADAAFMKKVEDRVIKPTVDGLKKDGIQYKGFIFFGLMNVQGDPFVIEYNVRMGDPETESVIPRIKNDFVEMLDAVAKEELHKIKIETDDRCCVTLMLVSGGYPGPYEKGIPITGLDKIQDSIIFHAGTTVSNSNEIVTSGGRVLGITSLAPDMADALACSYKNAEQINYQGKYCRKDIGMDLMKK
jgi:phosphoribosylamine---glycine ligase